MIELELGFICGAICGPVIYYVAVLVHEFYRDWKAGLLRTRKS